MRTTGGARRCPPSIGVGRSAASPRAARRAPRVGAAGVEVVQVTSWSSRVLLREKGFRHPPARAGVGARVGCRRRVGPTLPSVARRGGGNSVGEAVATGIVHVFSRTPRREFRCRKSEQGASDGRHAHRRPRTGGEALLPPRPFRAVRRRRYPRDTGAEADLQTLPNTTHTHTEVRMTEHSPRRSRLEQGGAEASLYCRRVFNF